MVTVKKIALLAGLVILAVLLAGCGKAKTPENPGVQVGSEWTYNVLFYKYIGDITDTSNITDNTTWTYTLAEFNVMPPDLTPCPPAPDAVTCSQILINHTVSGTAPIRTPTTAPNFIYYHNSTQWVSSNSSDGMLDQLQYWALDGIIFGINLRQEWAYHNYTLVSGTNIGIPYTVGNSWLYNVTSQANMGGVVPGSGQCAGTTFNFPYLAEVVAANLTVTVPAGTFTDVIQIDNYCDWNLDGVFERGNVTVSELWAESSGLTTSGLMAHREDQVAST
jgi:hypothetical protein